MTCASKSWAEPATETTDGAVYYLLATPEDLAWFRDAVNATSADAAAPDINAKLTADIDLSGYESWTPIGQGTDATPNGYEGIFDGNGHSVTGYTVTAHVEVRGYENNSDVSGYTPRASGLFGFVSGTIRNLRASGTVSINEETTGIALCVGGIAGYLQTGQSLIENCSFYGNEESSVTVNSVDRTYAGGIVGHADTDGVALIGCSNESAGDISITMTAGNQSAVGGIIGMSGEKASIIDCVKSGSGNIVTNSPGRGVAGGVIGYAFYSVDNCVNSGAGNVTGISTSSSKVYAYAGGIVGYADDDSPVTNCSYSGSGNIEANSNFDGTYTSNCNAYTGGIAGSAYAGVQNCTNSGSGDITGSAGSSPYVGGIVGYAQKQPVTNCVMSGSGDIEANATVWNSYAGGIAGRSDLGVENCINIGTGDIASSTEASNKNACAAGITGAGNATECVMSGTGTISASAPNESNQLAGGLIATEGSSSDCAWNKTENSPEYANPGGTREDPNPTNEGVTVVKDVELDSAVVALSASISSNTMYVGADETITVSALPGDNGTINITDFSSSDDTIVAVSEGEYGTLVLTGVREGTATVTLSAEAEATDFSSLAGGESGGDVTSGDITSGDVTSGDVTAETKKVVLKNVSFTVTVSNVALEGISLPASVQMKAGDTQTINVTYTPGDATEKGVTWSSSNESVVTVTPAAEKGAATLRAVSAGTATVTATSDDGAHTAQCSVTVSAAETDTPDTPPPTPEQPQHSGGGGGGGCSAGFGALALLAFIPIVMRRKK
ncbi:Ig-like domain-containing protein [Cloacibacillus sp. An23]|uniref:Ig-like domain-containing protein n=1 Tax=Cloacibacillus sp. An23 TaxID=1965591 RepID=UPI000B370946|nr:Ig-like domain-containing protein [Cloacibacillus sp. An23]OUO93851.1 hypothetical protein B5F39_06630 [Cloacibacillus sp. An23]